MGAISHFTTAYTIVWFVLILPAGLLHNFNIQLFLLTLLNVWRVLD